MNCRIGPCKSSNFPDLVILDNSRLLISFRRTLRVPKTDGDYPLPPELGLFPLFSVKQFEKYLPESMVATGGLFFPMHEREAMWIRFKSDRQFAVKIYVGGVNVVSGEPAMENVETKLRRQKLHSEEESLQDYIVTPWQAWIDGLTTAPGMARQFVVATGGQGFAAQSQITGEAVVGELQFEVTKGGTPMSVTYLGTTKVMRVGLASGIPGFMEDFEKEFGLLKGGSKGLRIRSVPNRAFSLAYWGIRPGDEIVVEQVFGPNTITITAKSLSGKLFRTQIRCDTTVRDLKEVLAKEWQLLGLRLETIYNGEVLDDGKFSGDPLSHGSFIYVNIYFPGQRSRNDPVGWETGITARGQIIQEIDRDKYRPEDWDRSSTTTFNVQVLSAAVFERMLGIAPPPCSIKPRTYRKHKLPFFELPDEQTSLVEGQLERLQLEPGEPMEGIETGFKYPEDWKEYAVVQLNPDGPKREFRTVSELEAEVEAGMFQ
ncbi:hypothetical protein AJ79_05476 [Helicocarpus griseus UAMH5409]|uniref:Ubiquitin-like domain-containing protein n=1 Tax=Helicocarpus griseus UAMH5409 TaxID=1447875 RepID=A0A2B7XN75_9EURO|nr:hypothetical protein AJ79_05476 [Helicocarpus griseus UAMH5409]